MTNAKEVACYAAAHVIGFALSAVLTQFVMIPIYMSAEMAAHPAGRYVVSFIFFVIVQTVVFGAFIAMRGRPTATP